MPSKTCGIVLSTMDHFYIEDLSFAAKKAFECNSGRTFMVEHQGVTNVIIGAKDKEDVFSIMINEGNIDLDEMVGIGMNRAQARDYAYSEFMDMVRQL